jgi:hypothetical protein
MNVALSPLAALRDAGPAPRAWAAAVLLAALLGAGGCAGSNPAAAPYPLREYHGLGDGPVVLDSGQDAALLPQVQQAMQGRVFYFGLFHRFDTGAEQVKLEDRQPVGSGLDGVDDQPGLWARQDGGLTLAGTDATYYEPLSRIPPELTQLVLRGSFDATALDALVPPLAALPFDPARSPAAAASAGTVTVRWELTGLLNGVPFDEHFTQPLELVAVDANVS